MPLDPTLLELAFVESYLKQRENDKWKGYVKLSEIDPDTLENDTKIDPEIKQKILNCIDSIRKIHTMRSVQERIKLVMEFYFKEEQEKQGAAAKVSGVFGIFKRPFVKQDPEQAQLDRALRALILNSLREKEEFASYLNELNIRLSANEEPADDGTAESKDQVLKYALLKKEIEILECSKRYEQEFFNTWIKTSPEAIELKEESLQMFRSNVENKVRDLEFCQRTVKSLPSANTIEPVAAPVAPPVKIVETPVAPPFKIVETPVVPSVKVVEAPVAAPVKAVEAPVAAPVKVVEPPVAPPVKRVEKPVVVKATALEILAAEAAKSVERPVVAAPKKVEIAAAQPVKPAVVEGKPRRSFAEVVAARPAAPVVTRAAVKSTEPDPEIEINYPPLKSSLAAHSKFAPRDRKRNPKFNDDYVYGYRK